METKTLRYYITGKKIKIFSVDSLREITIHLVDGGKIKIVANVDEDTGKPTIGYGIVYPQVTCELCGKDLIATDDPKTVSIINDWKRRGKSLTCEELYKEYLTATVYPVHEAARQLLIERGHNEIDDAWTNISKAVSQMTSDTREHVAKKLQKLLDEETKE